MISWPTPSGTIPRRLRPSPFERVMIMTLRHNAPPHCVPPAPRRTNNSRCLPSRDTGTFMYTCSHPHTHASARNPSPALSPRTDHGERDHTQRSHSLCVFLSVQASRPFCSVPLEQSSSIVIYFGFNFCRGRAVQCVA